MRAAIGVIAAVVLGTVSGCPRFEIFACTDSSQCVLNGLAGRCESSGYCSFPDPDCDSGSRYSEHAPSGLAHQCVDFDPVAGTGGGETGGSVGGGSGDSDGSADADESEGTPACVDLDGDGAGVGPGCEGSDCDDDNPNAVDGCLYLAPDGDDADPGTRDAPWRTFARAIEALAPGDSLVVLDGTYTLDDHGTLDVECGTNGVGGTEVAPIFVRAENDRMAVVDRQAAAHGVRLEDCDYWRVRGLSVISGDLAADEDGEWRSALGVYGSRHIEVRRLLVSHANRYFNEHTIQVSGGDDVLLEDVEAHDFFRSGFTFYATNNATCRRCYGHSHGATDLPNCADADDCPEGSSVGDLACPKCSAGDENRGDTTFYVEHSNDILLENCVSEGSHRGFYLVGGDQDGVRAGSGLRVVESVSIDDNIGLDIQQNSGLIPPHGAEISDLAIIAPNLYGARIEDPDALTLRNVTVLDPVQSGIVVAESTPANCLRGSCSIAMDHILVSGAGDMGFDLRVPVDTWSLEASNAVGSGVADYAYPSSDTDAPDDGEGNVRACTMEVATRVGQAEGDCRVYIPADSTMHDVAGDGVDIGANVTDRHIGGVPVSEALWDETGGFPCGPDPAAPAPIPGERCLDLAERTAVGSPGCPTPVPQG
ncbi:MAG: hypothetical protein AAF721_25475 [Myxococcota bacterium]